MTAVTPAGTRADAAARVRLENPIKLSEACRYVPCRRTPRGHVSQSTLLRWIVGGKGGVRLDACRIAHEWHTSLPAIERFRQATGG